MTLTSYNIHLLCDLIWQVMLRSSVMGFHRELYSILPFLLVKLMGVLFPLSNFGPFLYSAVIMVQ